MDTQKMADIKVIVAKVILIATLIACGILSFNYDLYWVWGSGWVFCGVVAMILIYKDWRSKFVPIGLVVHALVGMAGLLMACIHEVHTTDLNEFSKQE